MDYTEIRQRAIEWMTARGWKSSWGKRGAFTQSLLQHTDVELNALCTLLPMLKEKAHYGLTQAEEQALIVGTVAHDVGKETREWQAYVQLPAELQRGRFVPHIIPSLTEVVVPELVGHFGFDPSIVPDAVVFVNLHMKAVRTGTNLLGVLTTKSGGSNRWAVLARIVDTIDNFCSIRGLLPTLAAIQRDANTGGAVGPHVRLGYHLLSLRGVSTTLLHRAAEDAYRANGWAPLLYFSNGTIYVADSRADMVEPEADTVMMRLTEVVDEVVPTQSLAKIVVGSPIATMLPKPEWFDYRELPSYLHEASRRIKRGSFLRKPAPSRQAKMRDNKGGGYWDLSGKSGAEQDLVVDSERIDRAQPFMLILKLFRDALKPEVISRTGGFADPAQVAQLVKTRDEMLAKGGDEEKLQARHERAIQKLNTVGAASFEARVTERYDTVFGGGAFARLQSTSTLMPAREMAAIIDPLWSLPGHVLGLPVARLELADDNQLRRALIAKLDEIARSVYEELPVEQRPTRVTAREIADCFREDVVHPAPRLDLAELASEQRTAYINSKPGALRASSPVHLCPICNTSFFKGSAATADFVAKPESHTNRAVSHGPAGSIIICEACKYERFLQELLLGEKVTRVLVLTPRMHVGYLAGQAFRDHAHRFYETAQALMTNSTTNPNQNVTLALTNVISRKLLHDRGEGSELVRAVRKGFDGASLAHLLTYRMSAENQKKYRRELGKALREIYDFEEGREDVAVLNDYWGTSFLDWEDAIDVVVAGQVHDDQVDEVRARVYRLRPQFRVVCETPNFILVPLVNGFAAGKDESDTNAALRELFILLLVGLALDCSVAGVDGGEPITFEGGEGVARVPTVPAVRDLVGSEWVGLTDAPIWLEKIGAASLLASATNYPERSNLYQILKAPTPGHVLRRIEMEQKGAISSDQPSLIRQALQEVPHA